MYEYIKGKIVVKRVDYVAIDINGIAYKIYISLKTYESIKNSEEKLYIYTHVKEEAFKLFGFYTEEERKFFVILVNASGVGPKLAIAVLSTYSIAELKDIIINEQLKRLIKVPGLGMKKGQKLILDIKDKIKLTGEIGEETAETNNGYKLEEDIILALQSLGYGEKEIKKLLKTEDIMKYTSIEEAIKDILKKSRK
ncbi:Holliday junction branch migration protein RuvA [Haliovirga abyssi]|uniref:Holliday junction branch migration complex subunit RuvA n=1 Tax=Haliovirga abyssi TaxID=2996794 RepID=A0AAU9DLD2_9FUSO|nr:Holliday junction branch migration protein RuvA [Haliovirga abyssi]BDU50757.1 Holliday junction ATP-dependent DNA helicase RuvA [Haliovirga abyssi]